MTKNDDPFLLWVIAGVIGVIARDIYGAFAKLIGLATHLIYNISADLFVHNQEVFSVPGYILGFLADFVVGAMVGILIGLLLEWRGLKHYLLKGMGVALLTWLFLYGMLFHNLPTTAQLAPKDALSNISGFISHAIFGITTAWVYLKLAKLKAPKPTWGRH